MLFNDRQYPPASSKTVIMCIFVLPGMQKRPKYVIPKNTYSSRVFLRSWRIKGWAFSPSFASIWIANDREKDKNKTEHKWERPEWSLIKPLNKHCPGLVVSQGWGHFQCQSSDRSSCFCAASPHMSVFLLACLLLTHYRDRQYAADCNWIVSSNWKST